MILGMIFKFDAAHSLPNHQGKCARVHGHTYKVEVQVSGQINTDDTSPTWGMVADFGGLKEVIGKVIDNLDHCSLNDHFPNPTAENLAHYFAMVLTERLAKFSVAVESVKVWETENCYAEWRR